MAQVKIGDVSKAFGVVRVLEDVDIDISDGEFMVFVGPSGCGKTTLLRTIAGLERPSSGRVMIGERRCHRAGLRQGAASPWCSSPTRSTRT